MILDLLAKQHVSDVNVASLYGRMALEGCYLADLHNERERDRGMVGMLLILSVCVSRMRRVSWACVSSSAAVTSPPGPRRARRVSRDL